MVGLIFETSFLEVDFNLPSTTMNGSFNSNLEPITDIVILELTLTLLK